MTSPPTASYNIDDQLLEQLSALASLVDGAWHITHGRNREGEALGDLEREKALDEWSTQRAVVLGGFGKSTLMNRLKDRFGLETWHQALLLLCALPQIDLRYQKIYADLHPNNQPVPCLEIIFNLICAFPQRKRQWLGELLSDSPLVKWRLVIFPGGSPEHTSAAQPYLLTTPIFLAPDVFQIFMNAEVSGSSPYDCLFRVPEPTHICVPPADVHLRQPGLLTSRLVQLCGPPGIGRRTMARNLAIHRPLYELNSERFQQQSDPAVVLRDTLRQVILAEAELIWPGGLEVLQNNTELASLLADWLNLPGNRCWLLSETPGGWPASLNRARPVQVIMDLPDIQTSISLWNSLSTHYLSDCNCEADWNQVASHYQLTPHAIEQVLLALRSTPDSDEAITTIRVMDECLAQTPVTLSGLATRVPPVYTLDDVVVSGDTRQHLQEILHRYKQRHLLCEHQLSSNSGLHVLFWGKPGTGKTMTAEALSNSLSLPLYKANLASISSKWIGETEKHLASLFDDAERNNGLLFFDEADAVFSRRSQVESSHDKNANLGVSYLLQRMECYNGLLILATNFKSNLDPAFMRRMHFSLEFVQPDAKLRLALWTHWLGKVHHWENLDEQWLANELELAGAQIRNIVQHSAALALAEQGEGGQKGPVTVNRSHLARAIYRESQKNDNSFLITTRLASWHKLRPSVKD